MHSDASEGLVLAKILVAIIVGAFVVFFIMTSPDQAANIVHATWRLAVNVAHGVATFVDKLSA
jgi:hypothetical protein